ncbi:hypothetical protein J4N45_10230 [Vibrio sp. SCSIO 43140]|uniref:hypothetical protein n=1 Tax=Vibrio sp. SCSIO 43140 TaxID=2819100 RepID=UPI002075E311|nr:hypothetical protein [Vibrio sp. SCSIO 43140]USD58906.1 hypothetical protein J4N45_10230 [Vibrio sp. SCSIO 43140]
MIIDFNKDPFTKDDLDIIKRDNEFKDNICSVVQFFVFFFILLFALRLGINPESEDDSALAIILAYLAFGSLLFSKLIIDSLIPRKLVQVLEVTKFPSKRELEQSNYSPNDIWNLVKNDSELSSYVDKTIAMKRPLINLEVETIIQTTQGISQQRKYDVWVRNYQLLRGMTNASLNKPNGS